MNKSVLKGNILELELGTFELHHWPPNNPDLNPVDFQIQGLSEQNVYQRRKINDLDSLKDIIEEWDKIR